MKKIIILDIVLNFVAFILMCLPVYCFAVGPLIMITINIYFDLKHKNKFVLWRLFHISALTFAAYKIQILLYEISYFREYNCMPYEMSYTISDIFFTVALIIPAVAFVAYQILVLLACLHNKSENKNNKTST